MTASRTAPRAPITPSSTDGTGRITGHGDRVVWHRTASGLYLPVLPAPWRTTRAGLYVQVPLGEPVAPALPDPAPPPPAYAAMDPVDLAMLRATRGQAHATWLGAGVALIALAVSWFAWSGQQDMNGQQRELNEYLILREQRVYASGVVMWADDGDEVNSVLTPGLDVTLQNRAPVPIRDVRIHAAVHANDPEVTTQGAITLGDIAPCQDLRFRLSPPGDMDFATAVPWISFSETDRRWVLEGSKLTLSTGDPAPVSSAPPARLLIPRSMTRDPLAGCDGTT